MLTLADIRTRLGLRTAAVAERGSLAHAAVALVLRDAASGPEALFIERTEHDHDPWSGHVGFPGGRVEPEDQGPRGAAERETLEEVGLDLAAAEYLGRLDDLRGAHLPVLVSCFVYAVEGSPGLSPNPAEVKQAFWFPLRDLFDPHRRTERTYRFNGEDVTYPAVRVLGEGRPWLWGITYRLVSQLLEVAGRPL